MADEKIGLPEFMLKEYEKLADAYFNSHEIMAKWVKYWLVIMAVPFSIIAFIYKDHASSFNIYSLSDTLSILLFLIGILGLFIYFIILNARLDATLYARSVNGVRKYFWDRGKSETEELKNPENESKYRVLPDDVRKPKFFKMTDLAWLTVLVGIINSFYISIGLTQTEIFKTYAPQITQNKFLIFIAFVLIHIAYYLRSALKREKLYSTSE